MTELLTVDEHSSFSYGPRTYLNARYSDFTVAFAVNFNTAGEILTEKAARDSILQFQINEQFKPINAARTLYQYVKQHGFKTINIAGNGIYTFATYGYNQHQINKLVYETLEPVHKHLSFTRLRSGGQTGADLAGAVSGVLLGIPTIVTYPKNFRQRLTDGMDIIQSKEEATDTIMRYVEQLQQELK